MSNLKIGDGVRHNCVMLMTPTNNMIVICRIFCVCNKNLREEILWQEV
ncbi:hypothetical protein AB2T14_001584 [Clostridium botulinum]